MGPTLDNINWERYTSYWDPRTITSQSILRWRISVQCRPCPEASLECKVAYKLNGCGSHVYGDSFSRGFPGMQEYIHCIVPSIHNCHLS